MHPKRPYTKTTTEAVKLLGQLVKLARKRRRMSEKELAERANIARATVQKIERGDPTVNIGLAFEAASVVGVPLFNAGNAQDITKHRETIRDRLTLLTPIARKADDELKDDF